MVYFDRIEVVDMLDLLAGMEHTPIATLITSEPLLLKVSYFTTRCDVD